MQDALTNAKKAWNPGKRKIRHIRKKKKKKNIKNKNKGGSKRSKTPKAGKRSSGKAKSRQKSD